MLTPLAPHPLINRAVPLPLQSIPTVAKKKFAVLFFFYFLSLLFPFFLSFSRFDRDFAPAMP